MTPTTSSTSSPVSIGKVRGSSRIDRKNPHVDLANVLAKRMSGSVKFDDMTRALFATDASNYRHVPIGVVQPRSVDDALIALEVCRERDVAVLPRGAATSTSGQACNEAVVFDLVRHINKDMHIDPAARTAYVQSGLVLDRLNEQAAKHGLIFGPDPSTHARCTIGGMIGNNSCGAHSISTGKTVDNVLTLDIALYDGTRLTVGPTSDDELRDLCARTDRVGELYRALVAIRDTYADDVRREFPVMPRRVSGYNLDELLPENGFNVARALVGTEGTCALVLGATLQLVKKPAFTQLTVVGFRDVYTAADHVPALLNLKAFAIEGFDAGLVAAFRSRNPNATVHTLLPEGAAWILVETEGETQEEAMAGAEGVVSHLREHFTGAAIVTDPLAARALWRIREDGAGIATRNDDGGEAWPGWEDPAVPPEHLGDYLREFESLLKAEQLHAITFGHFGDGCAHSRIDFDFTSTEGVAQFRRFIEEAANLVVKHGGSLSGEHGDGQARGELLAKMYSPRLIEAFVEFKRAFDPAEKMNPRNVVSPRAIDADLRIYEQPATINAKSQLAMHADSGDIAAATRRCIGVGRCLTTSGGVMCPSYRATKEERYSPRGRSHLLFEMLNGDLVSDGWRSEEVREALDLCLGCKGCKSDCPVNVDIATYKSEFLARFYKRRIRPVSHYSMGYLPTWLRLGSKTPRLVNLVMGSPLASLLKRLGGIAPERDLPHLAKSTFQTQFKNTHMPEVTSGEKGTVVLWPDSFTNYFEPGIGLDAVKVLTSLGYSVEVPEVNVCCGLTWLSTGQITKAQSVLRSSLDALSPWLENGTPIIGLEPSCTALLRKDATELLPDDARTATLSKQVHTFAEFLTANNHEWPTPSQATNALAQVHCHQHAELGFNADRQLLADIGVDCSVLDAGCCGLAGNFGFERNHYDVSKAVAEGAMLPAINAVDHDVAVLADGFSCRTQIRELSERSPVHLASLVAQVLGLKKS